MLTSRYGPFRSVPPHVPQTGRGIIQPIAPPSNATGSERIRPTHQAERSRLNRVASSNMPDMVVTPPVSQRPIGLSKVVSRNM